MKRNVSTINAVEEEYSQADLLEILTTAISQHLNQIQFLRMISLHLRKVSAFVIQMIYLKTFLIMIHLNPISLRSRISLVDLACLMRISMINLINFHQVVLVVHHQIRPTKSIVQIEKELAHLHVS